MAFESLRYGEPMPSIKVFISHASEDKDRFVLDFAKRLRTNNIDAWIDIWEMLRVIC